APLSRNFGAFGRRPDSSSKMPNRSDTTAAKLSADEMQLKARKQRRFPETEASLPAFGPKKHLSLASQLLGAVELLSYLGSRNPLPRPVVPGDEVWVLDNVAFKPSKNSAWQAEFVVAVFEKESKDHLMDAVAIISRIIGLADEA